MKVDDHWGERSGGLIMQSTFNRTNIDQTLKKTFDRSHRLSPECRGLDATPSLASQRVPTKLPEVVEAREEIVSRKSTPNRHLKLKSNYGALDEDVK